MEKSRLPLFGRTPSSSKKKKQPPSGRTVNPVAAAFSDATAMAEVSTSHSSRRYCRDNSLVSTFVSRERPQGTLSDNKSPPPVTPVSCFSDRSSPSPHGAGRDMPHVMISSDRPCYPVSASYIDNPNPDISGKKVQPLHNNKTDSNSVLRVICSTEQSQLNRGHRSLPDKAKRSPPLRGGVTDAMISAGNERSASIPIMCRGSPLPLRRQDGNSGEQRTTACPVKPHRSYSNPEDRHLAKQTPNTGHTQHQSLSAKRVHTKEKPSPASDASKVDESVAVVKRDRLYSYPEDTECDEPGINSDNYDDSPPQQCPQVPGEHVMTLQDKRWAEQVAVNKHQSSQPVHAMEKKCLSLVGLSPSCDCKTNIYESMPPSPIYETIDQVYVRAFPKTVSTAFVSPCCGVRMAELRATKRVSYTRSHSASPEPHSVISPPPLPPRNPGTKISYGGGEQQASPEGFLCVRSSVRTSKMQYVGDSPDTVFYQGSTGRPSPVGTLSIVDQCYTNTQTCLQTEQTIWDCRGGIEEEFSHHSSPGWSDSLSQTDDMSPVYGSSTKRNSGKQTSVGALQPNLPDLVNVIEIAAHRKESSMPQYGNVPKKQLPQHTREAHANSKNLSNDIDHVSKPRIPHQGSTERRPITVIRDTTIHDGPQTKKTVHVTAAERCDVESKIKRFEGDGSPHRDRSGSRDKYDHQLSTSSICNKWLAASKLKSVSARQKTVAANTTATKQQSPPEISPASTTSQNNAGACRATKPPVLKHALSKSKLQYSEQQSRLSRSRQCIAKAKSRTAPAEIETVKREGSRLPSGVRGNDKFGSTRQLARRQPRQTQSGHEDMVQSTSSNEPCSSVTSSCASLASVFNETSNASSSCQDPRRPPRVLKGRSNHSASTKGYSEMSLDNDGGVTGKVMHGAQKPSKPVHVKQSKQHKISKLPLNRSGSFSDVQSCNSNTSSRSQSVKSKQIRHIAAGRTGVCAGGLGIDPVLDRCAYSEEKVKNWNCVPDGQPQKVITDPAAKAVSKNIERRQVSSRTSKLPPRPVRAECTSPPASVSSVGMTDIPSTPQLSDTKPPKDTTPVKASPNSQTGTEHGSGSKTAPTAKKQVAYSSKLAKVSRLKPPGGTKKGISADNKPLAKQCVDNRDELSIPASPKSVSLTGDAQSIISVKQQRKLVQPESVCRDSHGEDDTGSCSSWGSGQPDLTKHSPECGLMLVKPYSVKNRRQHLPRGIFTKTKSVENDAADTTNRCMQEVSSNDSRSPEQTVQVESECNICSSSTAAAFPEKQSQLPQTNMAGDQREHATHLVVSQSDCQVNSPENAAAVASMSRGRETMEQCDGCSGSNCSQSVATCGGDGQGKTDKHGEQRCISATETNTKTSPINKADVYYHHSDQVPTRLAGASSADTAISDITTKAAATTPGVLSKTKADFTDNFTDHSSDAIRSKKRDGKDNSDCSYQDDQKLIGHLSDPIHPVEANKSVQIKRMVPGQCTDVSYKSKVQDCEEKHSGGQQFVCSAISNVRPPVEELTFLETTLASEGIKTRGSTESLTGHHDDAITKVKDTNQASSDLLGNIRLSESGYDSWKSQGSNSTTCGRDELIEIDVASWGIFDDKGETVIHIDAAQKTAVALEEELPFTMRKVRGRVCTEACPAASLSGSEDTLTPERLIDGNDFGSDLSSSVGVFGDGMTEGLVGPKEQSTTKITRKTEPVKPAILSVEPSAVSVSTEATSGVGLDSTRAVDSEKQDLTAVDMLFSNMYSNNDNGNKTEKDKTNLTSPVSNHLFENNGNDTKEETIPVKLRHPRTKQSHPAQRPDTLFPSTPRHSCIIENTELQASSSSSCDLDDNHGDNPWLASPTWEKNKRHSAILSPGRVTRPVSLSSSSPSLDMAELDGEQQGLLAYISTSYLLDEGSLRRSTATSSLNMQRKQEAEEAIVETAVSETSLHVQPSDGSVRGEIGTEKSTNKIKAVSTTPKVVAEKPLKSHDAGDSNKNSCDAMNADRKENAIRLLPQPAVVNNSPTVTQTGPQSSIPTCVSSSASPDSVAVSPSLHTNGASKSKLQVPASHQRVSKLRPVTSVKTSTAVKSTGAVSKQNTKEKETASSGISFQSVMGSLRQATVTLYRRTSNHTSSPTRAHSEVSHKADAQQKLPTGSTTKMPNSSGIPSPGKNTTKQSKLSSFSPKMPHKSSIPGKTKKKSSSVSDAPSPVAEKQALRCSQSDPSGRHVTGRNVETGIGNDSQIPPKSLGRTTQDNRTSPASGMATKVGLSRISRPVHPRLGPGKSMVKLPRSAASEDNHR